MTVSSVVKTMKERHSHDREVRFYRHDKIELCYSLTLCIIPGGVLPGANSKVIYVGRRAFKRTMTDDPSILRTAWSHNETTEGCIARFDTLVDSYF
eukprot:SAG11_NODE_5133_length_1655_cov_14.872108_1_plen_95_part_10